MKCFVVLSALVAVAFAEADPWMGYGGYGGYGAVGYGAPAIGLRRTYAVQAPLVRAAPVIRHAAPAIAHAAPAAYAAPAIAHAAPVVHAAPAAYAAPAAIVKAPAGPIATQYHKQDEFANFEYGYSNPNSAKHEAGNAYTGVKGSYSYVDGYGLNQRVDYVADGAGFRATGTNFPTTPATLGLHRRRRSIIASGYGLPAPVTGYAGAYGAPALTGYSGSYAAPALTGYAGSYAAPALTGYSGSYAAPALSHGYASPIAAQSYAAPISHGYGAPAAISHGYGAPAAISHGYGAPAAIVKSAPAVREATLTKVKLNPGHAEAYRVY